MTRKIGYKHSEETKRKIKESNIKYFKEYSEKRLGKNNSFYGKKHTKETKEKIKNSKYHKDLKGKNNPNYSNNKLKGHKMTKEQCIKISKAKKRDKNPAWIDGRSYFPYPSEFNDKLRNKIRKRDNYECQNCDMTQKEHFIVYGRDIEVHHIDYNRKNCNENNLTTLCKQCNLRANYNRNYWKEYFKRYKKWKKEYEKS